MEPDDIEEEIGARIRAVRRDLELTQREVADRASLSPETVSRIERGVQGVTFPNVYRLAEALSVSFSELCDLDLARQEVVASTRSRRVRELLEDASPEQLDLLVEMAESIIDWSRSREPVPEE